MNINNKSILNTVEISEVGITNGLVAWYPLNGDTKDYTTGGNDGTNNGALATDRGYNFDGATTDILIPANTELAANLSNDISICFWINFNQLVGRTTLINKAYGGEFTINIETTSKLNCYRGVGGGDNQPYSSFNALYTIPLNTWTFYCLTFSGTTANWYLNGAQDATATNANYAGSQSTSNITIGSGYTGGVFDGLLSDVRFYNRALSAEEISILHEITDPTSNIQMKQTKNNLYIKGQIKEI